MSSAPAIRQARATDLPAAVALLEEARLPLEGFAEHLEHALVAEEGTGIVGCVELEIYQDAALLRSLVVAPGQRGRRLGERLTQEALRLAGERGASDVYLLTETASGFFPRFGFAPADRALAPPALRESVEFRSACPASARMMHARLGDE